MLLWSSAASLGENERKIMLRCQHSFLPQGTPSSALEHKWRMVSETSLSAKNIVNINRFFTYSTDLSSAILENSFIFTSTLRKPPILANLMFSGSGLRIPIA